MRDRRHVPDAVDNRKGSLPEGASEQSGHQPRGPRSSIPGHEASGDSEIAIIRQGILKREERFKIKNRLPGRGGHIRPALPGDFVPRARATPIFDECPCRVFLSATLDALSDKISEGLDFSPLLFASLQAQQVKQDRLMNKDRLNARRVTESRMERHGASIRVTDEVKRAIDAGEDVLDQRHFMLDPETPLQRKAVLVLGKAGFPVESIAARRSWCNMSLRIVGLSLAFQARLPALADPRDKRYRAAGGSLRSRLQSILLRAGQSRSGSVT